VATEDQQQPAPPPAPPESSPGTTTRPASATGLLAGLVGLIVGTVTVFLSTSWSLEPYERALVVALATAVAMVVVEIGWNRVHRLPSTGLAPDAINDWDVKRVLQKLVAFWVIVLVLVAAYFWLIPEYQGDFYLPFKQAALFVLPWLLLVSPFYVAYVDRRQLEPEDGYVDLYRAMTGHVPADRSQLVLLGQGWLVKAFFLPIMFVFLTSNIESTQASVLSGAFDSFQSFYGLAYNLFYLWDVIPAFVGYTLTLRLIDSQIRSVEPTLLGWVVCVACYPPFWAGITWTYVAYNGDELYWADFTSGSPWLSVLWGSTILALLVVYVWGTAMFGTRFSNLTHRGILTGGPFRWVKHPAYLSKNITWWLISVPFLTRGDWALALKSSLLLGAVNGIYYLRARTEERHLKRDPVYVAYAAYVDEHGLFAHVRRRLGIRRPRPVVIDLGD
jgi:isoprenylcysteine carboxyl methyltransferase (ICMT) family protein YpbQ